MISTAIYTMIYYYIIPADIQTKNLSFFVSSEVDTRLMKGDVVKTIPNLKSIVEITNPMYGQSGNKAEYDEVQLTMDNEYYNLYLEFTVQESSHNMDKGGTLYLASKMTSLRGN
jgi:hypothetical protein